MVSRASVGTCVHRGSSPLSTRNREHIVQVQISTRRGELSQATQEKITKKLEKLQRFFDRITAVDVTVDLTKADEPIIDVRVSAESANDFLARDSSKDMFGSLDAIIAKLEQQIKKYKEKIQNHSRPSVAEATAVAAEDVPE